MNPNRSRHARQGGMVLMVALVMLVILTLFAVTAMRGSSIGFKIVGNQQAQKLMEASAQEAMEQVISSLSNFDPVTIVPWSTTVAQRVCINGTVPVAIPPATCASGTQVDVQPVRCIASTRSQYDSLTQPMATYDNTWEIVATVTDSVTGAKATYHQGVKIRMLTNSCPGLT